MPKKKPAKKKAKVEKPKPEGYVFGRPTMYSEDLAKRICRAIAVSTDSMTAICNRNDDFPVREVIWGWRLDYPDFANMYDTAKRAQADILAEEIKDIADDVSRDTITKQDREGNPYDVCNSEWIARSRLRVDTRKWIACKLLPKVYGDIARLDLLQDKNEELNKELEILRAQLDHTHRKEY